MSVVVLFIFVFFCEATVWYTGAVSVVVLKLHIFGYRCGIS